MQTISVEKRKAPEGTRAFGGGTEIPCKYSWVYIFGGLYSGGGEGVIHEGLYSEFYGIHQIRNKRKG